MADEHMSLGQIEKFVKESIDQGKKWKEILLEGGEPTLHPRFFNIIDILMKYKKDFSPWTNIKVISNGYGDEVDRVLTSLPAVDVDVYNSLKKSPLQKNHCAFNVAPCDLKEFSQLDFSQGCYLPVFYGLGLTRYGYYPHPICGSIDRVFGFDIGRKKLPGVDDTMDDHFKRFCGLCGFFRFNITQKNKKCVVDNENGLRGKLSPTWKKAYMKYAEGRPRLTLYG
jgi:hypothetical protein